LQPSALICVGGVLRADDFARMLPIREVDLCLTTYHGDPIKVRKKTAKAGNAESPPSDGGGIAPASTVKRSFVLHQRRDVEQTWLQTKEMLYNNFYTALVASQSQTIYDCLLFDAVEIVRFCLAWRLKFSYFVSSDSITVHWMKTK
jgi:hypothetical protein